MALAQAFRNISENFRFQASLRGGLARRLAYLCVYYFLFIVFRWGDRHQRALDWLKRLRLSDALVSLETPDGVRLRLDLHTAFDPLYSIFRDRDYDRFEGLRLRPGMVVLDVGANLGVYTAMCAKAVGESGRVVAIEPHPGNAELLRQNIERNDFKNVRLVPAAAGDREGEAELFIHERAVNHSLVRRSGTSVRVPLRTVDDIVRELGLSKVDILKIDTEGTVPAVLRGASDVLKRLRPYVVFERDAAEESEGLRDLLGSVGYVCTDVSVFTYAWPKERPALVR